MIPHPTLQSIRDIARIEDVIADFVSLRKRGVNLVGLCPFHTERSPSFNVNPLRGIFKCFGCGKAGDVFAFLQEHESMSFYEAATWLAKRYHIELPDTPPSPEQAAQQHEAETLHIILEFAGKYYAWLLTNVDNAPSPATTYLQSRSIHPNSIEKFALGYAAGPDDLLHWLRKRGYSISHATQAGLCNATATRDFLRHRLIFPIHSLSGKIIAFAGRSIPSEDTQLKFPETMSQHHNQTPLSHRTLGEVERPPENSLPKATKPIGKRHDQAPRSHRKVNGGEHPLEILFPKATESISKHHDQVPFSHREEPVPTSREDEVDYPSENYLPMVTESTSKQLYQPPISHRRGGEVEPVTIRRQDGAEAKYLNTAESPIYHKSSTLYGLYQARKAIRQTDTCLLVEGYLDVISLHQAGLENVVASCGTALTVGQLQLIRRFTSNLTILYDGDAAGIHAALRGLDIALELDMNIKIVLLPKDEDPDSYIRKVGAEAFQTYLQTQARDFILFQAEMLLQPAHADPVLKSQAIHQIAASIAKVPDAIKRSLYIRTCALQVQVAEIILTEEISKIRASEMHKGNRQITLRPPDAGQPLFNTSKADDQPEHDLIRWLVCHGNQTLDEQGSTVADFLLNNLGDHDSLPQLFGVTLYRNIVKEFLVAINEKKILTEYYFTTHPSEDVRRLAQQLVDEDWPISAQWTLQENETESIQQRNTAVQQSLARFTVLKLTQLWERNYQRIQDCPSEDVTSLNNYIRTGMKILETRNRIASENAIVII